MTYLSIIWGIFTLIFLVLGSLHWRWSYRNVAHLQIKQSLPSGVEVHIEMAGINFVQFADNFNSYIDDYNQSTKKQNRFQAFGYWVASLTAIVSLVLTT